jgi:hypothetical protein
MSNKDTNKPLIIPRKTKSFRSLKEKITRRSIRKFEIERILDISRIIPLFTKFYSLLNDNEVMALRFYKSMGSRFQSNLLARETFIKGKSKELAFPFSKYDEDEFRLDILGKNNHEDYIPLSLNCDIKELMPFIQNSYNTRINLLNHLDKIYDNPNCPKLVNDIILFRGMDMSDNLRKLKVGDTYTFENFISTTLDRNVAEAYTPANNGCIFIFMDLKDIPYIYMPNSKLYYTEPTFSKFITQNNVISDLAEFTLPRNLEFRIEHIEKKKIIKSYDTESTPSFSKLAAIMKRKGIIGNTQTQTETQIEKQAQTARDIVDKSIFPDATFFFCSLVKWHPRNPLNFNEISKGAEFILDLDALNSWIPPKSNMYPRFMNG